MSIVISKHGHRLDNFIFISDEAKLPSIGNVNGGHAILRYKDKLVVCYNKYRNNWELPGGGKENGESISECVKREVYEEVGQRVDKLNLIGVSEVYIPRMGNSILWAVFCGEIDTLSYFLENDEMSKMTLWDMKSEIGDIDEVDFEIIKKVLYRNT
jgi:8-oxo-dGTP diphosphatase